MSGHNKWSQIKRKKAVLDARRGSRFTKMIREISVAAREGGGDPAFNPRLRLAVDQAKGANMPADNIERAILRGIGALEGVQYEELNYEGYGPGGVALFIETTTDNQNRTVAEVRHLLQKHGGNLGTTGSVAWQFDRKGQIFVDATSATEDVVLEVALLAGAEDVTLTGDEFVVTTAIPTFHTVQDQLREAGITFTLAELQMIPRNEVEVGVPDAERLLKLLDALDDHDDVSRVSSNAHLDAALLGEALSE
jgi:YebC/PmpR family DNA-binding regulatory protein